MTRFLVTASFPFKKLYLSGKNSVRLVSTMYMRETLGNILKKQEWQTKFGLKWLIKNTEKYT